MNSTCYKSFNNNSSQLTWYAASNDCLSRGGSLAVFANMGRPSDNSQLTDWLTTSGTDKAYWIGLVRSWWKTTDEGEFKLQRYSLLTMYWRFLAGRPARSMIGACLYDVVCPSVCLSVCDAVHCGAQSWRRGLKV